MNTFWEILAKIIVLLNYQKRRDQYIPLATRIKTIRLGLTKADFFPNQHTDPIWHPPFPVINYPSRKTFPFEEQFREKTS